MRFALPWTLALSLSTCVPAFVASTPNPAPVLVEQPQFVDLSAQPPGDSVPAVESFYEELAPYGNWNDDPTYGPVFVPGPYDYYGPYGGRLVPRGAVLPYVPPFVRGFLDRVIP